MTAFVDVGFKQVQEYLGRSRTLWGRRGASDLLLHASDATGQFSHRASQLGMSDIVKTTLRSFEPQVKVNTDALDIDGVISLTSSDNDKAWEAGLTLARAIRTQLPAITIEVSLRDHPSYAASLAQDATDHPKRKRTYWPRPFELPLQKLCDECGQSGASDYLADKDSWVCPDCWQRRPRKPRGQLYRALKKSRDPGVQVTSGFLAEQRLWTVIDSQTGAGRELAVAEDFAAIAKMPALADDAAQYRATQDNHLATIFADGNGLGGLFAEARARAADDGTEQSLEDLRTLSKGIKEATGEALLKATLEILRPDDTQLPVVPHIQGGDDILVTVPALRAWRFLRVFLEASQQGYTAFGQTNRPTMSAGIVICHDAFPIGDQVELAEELLRQAKRHVLGNGMSFAWTDVTWDGPRPAAGRPAWDLTKLNNRAKTLNAVVELPGSIRSSLRTMLSDPDPAARQARLQHFVTRMPESAPFLSGVLGADWTQSEVLSQAATQDVLDTLSLGRWWSE